MNITNRNAAFEWNAGGWFGGVIGSSVWMVVGAWALFSKNSSISVFWLASFVAMNCLGIFLWSRREFDDCYSSLQVQVGTTGVISLLAWGAAAIYQPNLADWLGSSIAAGFLWILFLFPGLMLVFFAKQHLQLWKSPTRNQQL